MTEIPWQVPSIYKHPKSNKALVDEIISLRESRQDLLSEATVVAEETMSIEPKLDFRHWKRTHFFDEADVEISEECPEVIFRNKIFYVALDSIISQLKTLFSAMKQICNEFSMLWNFRDMSDETDCLET